MSYPSRRIGVLLAGLAAAASFLLLALATRPTAAAAHRGDPRPTIVLVHGAWADSSSWAGVVRRLQHRGYSVDVPPDPLRGLQNDADYLRAYLGTVSGPVVLVGHSYGGAVITNAATGNANIKALVYIDAFLPDEGESVVQLATARPGSAIGGDPTHVFDFAPYPGAPAGDVDLYIKRTLFAHAFANDLPPRTAAVLAATQRPVTGSAVGAPSGPPAWKTIPSWYLLGTADNVIPPAQQRFMANRAHAQIVEVNASHLPMISRPRRVTRLIVAAARSGR
jgi:pimeloyl-ACP methyl ester carboxylesterase